MLPQKIRLCGAILACNAVHNYCDNSRRSGQLVRAQKTVMTTTTTTTPTAPSTPTPEQEAQRKAETIEKNGLTFRLVREETKGKTRTVKDETTGVEREETITTCYWNIPSGAKLAGLNDDDIKVLASESEAPEIKARQNTLLGRIFDAYSSLLGRDKAIDYIAARLDSAMRTAQLEAGKDNWTMDEKLKKAVSYIMESDFGRNRQGGIGALAARAAAAENFSRQQTALLQKQMLLMQKVMVAKTEQEKAEASAEMMLLMQEMSALAPK